MSSVFKKPKVKYIQPKEVTPEYVEPIDTLLDVEVKRKKKMGALSQILAKDNTYGSSGKTTLGA